MDPFRVIDEPYYGGARVHFIGGLLERAFAEPVVLCSVIEVEQAVRGTLGFSDAAESQVLVRMGRDVGGFAAPALHVKTKIDLALFSRREIGVRGFVASRGWVLSRKLLQKRVISNACSVFCTTWVRASGGRDRIQDGNAGRSLEGRGLLAGGAGEGRWAQGRDHTSW